MGVTEQLWDWCAVCFMLCISVQHQERHDVGMVVVVVVGLWYEPLD
jgi:hypothetical protein